MSSKTFTAEIPELPQMRAPAALLRAGPRVRVQIHKRGTYSPHVRGWALIDTGSGHSVIAIEAVRALRLPTVGDTYVETQGGRREVSVYPADIHIENAGLPTFKLVSAVGSQYLVRSNLAAILGRDALAAARLVYEGRSGRFTLEYPELPEY